MRTPCPLPQAAASPSIRRGTLDVMCEDSPQDVRTAAFYRESAPALAERYESVAPRLAERLASLLRPGARVLDVGAGSGRDRARLLTLGLDAYGAEPSLALRAEAVRRHPELAGRIADARLPHLGEPFGGAFDGVLLSAVLMHVPLDALPHAAASLARLLVPGGYLLSSVSSRRPGLDAENRDASGRLFVTLSSADLESLFGGAGLTLLDTSTSPDDFGRAGVEWLKTLFVKR